jgi:hypothetical protein
MKKLAGLVCIIYSSIGTAQDASIRKLQSESLYSFKKEVVVADVDTSTKKWKTGALYSINIGQGSLSNWAAGGDDFSLSIATALNLFACYQKGKTSWDNALDVSFGYVKTSSLGSRKNDDRFDLLSKYGYALNKKLNLATLSNFRSQFFKGYSYEETGKEGFIVKKKSSAFLSPASVLVSQGLDYKPGKSLSIFISPFTSRWVIINDDSLAAKGSYGILPGKNSINELGAFATIHYQKAFNKYVSYRGRIDVFSNYKRNPQNADVYMTNTLSARFAKVIAFSWNLDMIYDDDVELFGKNKQSPALQLRSMIGVGLQVKI